MKTNSGDESEADPCEAAVAKGVSAAEVKRGVVAEIATVVPIFIASRRVSFPFMDDGKVT